MTKHEPQAGGQAQLAKIGTKQDSMMDYESPSRDGSESDVATMDDFQFKASLDRLLDSELADSSSFAQEATAAAESNPPRTVSADPSVASSVSSVTTSPSRQQQQQQQTTRYAASSTFAAAPAAVAPFPQQPQSLSSNVTFPTPLPPAKTPMGPSPLTARLAYMGTPMSNAQATTITSLPPYAGGPYDVSSRNQPAYHVGDKRRLSSEAAVVMEDADEKVKRRNERNLREQQRSQKVTDQIRHLRELLMEVNVPCKPDKHSTLISVVDYITQLQNRSTMLDEEHKKLLETIAQTNEMVNNQYYQTTSDGSQVSSDLLNDTVQMPLEDENAVFVQGLDYKSVFARCGIALAVASIDGRFMDCNEEFERITGYTREELLPGAEASNKAEMRPDVAPTSSGTCSSPSKNLSLFNLLNRQDMGNVFSAMSSMLKKPVDPSTSATPHQDYWNGTVRQNRENDSTLLRMNLSLVRTPGGRPKFFNCSLTSQETS